MEKQIICLKCKKKLTEYSEVAFVNKENTEVICAKCFKKEPFRKLKKVY